MVNVLKDSDAWLQVNYSLTNTTLQMLAANELFKAKYKTDFLQKKRKEQKYRVIKYRSICRRLVFD